MNASIKGKGRLYMCDEKHRDVVLTIAIPTYNGKGTIGRMLDLLIPQLEEGVELLISDNCSDKESTEIINNYINKYKYIKYLRNKVNIGADANFLQCLRSASGKYTFLLSDDDVLVPGSLKRILSFLRKNEDMGLIYLGTANYYIKYTTSDNCILPKDFTEENICTDNRKIFMKFAHHYWGFISSFIVNSKEFKKIKNPEQYIGTYWLQSYIHILCSKDLKLGIVGGLCVAAGVYLQQNNFDVALVDGINYKKMIDFSIIYGFDKQQLYNWYIDRLCLLSSHALVKEKASGNSIINKRLLFECTKCYWQAWFKIYPFFFVPSFVCTFVLGMKRIMKGTTYKAGLNRVGDKHFT